MFALTANDSLSLGTSYTTHTHSQYVNTSQSSLFQTTGNYLTSQSNQALSGSNGSFTFQTASFGNSNGLSFYTTNGSIVGSYTVPSVPGATIFSNSNNVSFGLNGSTITATASFNQSVQPVAISGSNGSFAFSTLSFDNLIEMQGENNGWGCERCVVFRACYCPIPISWLFPN